MTFDYSHNASTRYSISENISLQTAPCSYAKKSFKRSETNFDKRVKGFYSSDFPSFLGSLQKGFSTSRASVHKEYDISDCQCYMKWTGEPTRLARCSAKAQFLPEDFSHFQSVFEKEDSLSYWPCDCLERLNKTKKKVYEFPNFLMKSLRRRARSFERKLFSSTKGEKVVLPGTFTEEEEVAGVENISYFDAEEYPTFLPCDFTGCFTNWFSEKQTKSFFPGEFNGLFEKWTSFEHKRKSTPKRTFHLYHFIGCANWFVEPHSAYLPGDFEGFYTLWTSDQEEVAHEEAVEILEEGIEEILEEEVEEVTEQEVEEISDDDTIVASDSTVRPGIVNGCLHEFTVTSSSISSDEMVKKAADVYLPSDLFGLYDYWDSESDYDEAPVHVGTEKNDGFVFESSDEAAKSECAPTLTQDPEASKVTLPKNIPHHAISDEKFESFSSLDFHFSGRSDVDTAEVFWPSDFNFHREMFKEDTTKVFYPGDFYFYKALTKEDNDTIYYPKNFFFLHDMFKESSLEVSHFDDLAGFYELCTKSEDFPSDKNKFKSSITSNETYASSSMSFRSHNSQRVSFVIQEPNTEQPWDTIRETVLKFFAWDTEQSGLSCFLDGLTR